MWLVMWIEIVSGNIQIGSRASAFDSNVAINPMFFPVPSVVSS